MFVLFILNYYVFTFFSTVYFFLYKMMQFKGYTYFFFIYCTMGLLSHIYFWNISQFFYTFFFL